MMDWIQRMNLVLEYIENNLDGEIDEDKIAKLSVSSKSMFRRIFTALTDMTLSEYIRKRRLTRAAHDIRNTNEKIIDIAVKYGYSSADAFGLAFKIFHGVTPCDAKNPDIQIQSFEPLSFKFILSVKGGNDMQERVIEISEELQRDMNATVAMIAQNAENSRVAMQIAQDIAKKFDDFQKLIEEISAANDEQALAVKFIMSKIEKSTNE